ncbi:AAA family ATPase [Wukongibacter baidiensis]|uniref:AAA family ATPase n=1 Tax=Wukongibacter baidiensis TaxID=1723361 RepID=UPI003D7F890C
MSKIFLFRGKAATGKTTITDLLSNELNVAILRKDDIYDKLSVFNLEHSEKNKASYDILEKILQTNIDTNSNLILDVSLAHNPYLNHFLSKIDLKGSQIYKFLCICSNQAEWKKRIEGRIKNPSPNQIFNSVQEAEQHYKKYDIAQVENEIILDSSDDISIIMKKIYEVVG